LISGLVERGGWEELDLRGLPEDEPWLQLLRTAAEEAGLSVEVTDDKEPVAPFLPLAGSWDEYLASLPSKLRHEIKRKARKLESELGAFTIVESTEETLGSDLDRFVELHEAIEVRPERLLRRLDDRERAELGLELPRLALDLVSELARERREVLVPRSRQRKERRDGLLVVGDLDREAGLLRRRAEELQPRLILREAAEVELLPTAAFHETRDQFARNELRVGRSGDWAEVIGDLRAAEEPDRRTEALERGD